MGAIFSKKVPVVLKVHDGIMLRKSKFKIPRVCARGIFLLFSWLKSCSEFVHSSVTNAVVKECIYLHPFMTILR